MLPWAAQPRAGCLAGQAAWLADVGLGVGSLVMI